MTYLRNAKKKKKQANKQQSCIKKKKKKKEIAFRPVELSDKAVRRRFKSRKKKKEKGARAPIARCRTRSRMGKKKMGKRGGMSICRDHHIETHAAAYQSAGSHRVPRRIAKYKTPRSHCNALNKQSEGATQRSTIKKQQQQLQVNH